MMRTIGDVRAAAIAGSYGHGSLRPEDVREAYLAAGGAVAEAAQAEGVECPALREALAELRAADPEDEYLPELCADVADAAAEVLPRPYYVGAHPGDGSDFGVWYDAEADPEPGDAPDPEDGGVTLAVYTVGKMYGEPQTVAVQAPRVPEWVTDPAARAAWYAEAARARMEGRRVELVRLPAGCIWPGGGAEDAEIRLYGRPHVRTMDGGREVELPLGWEARGALWEG